jgi:acyl-CoA thioesterase I
VIKFALICIVGLAVLFVAGNVLIAAQRAAAVPGHWQKLMRERVQPGDFTLVALGDSSVQGIGADRPEESYVGRIADYIARTTGRKVHVTNVATGGPITDVVTVQLPKVDARSADLVLFADDNVNGLSLEQYRVTIEAIVAALPVDRTVISDLPGLPGEGRYQSVLAQVADAHGIRRAKVAQTFRHEVRRPDIFSWLPPHLNSRGYWYWFMAFKPEVDQVLAAITR